jgi:phage-related minor tail protein
MSDLVESIEMLRQAIAAATPARQPSPNAVTKKQIALSTATSSHILHDVAQRLATIAPGTSNARRAAAAAPLDLESLNRSMSNAVTTLRARAAELGTLPSDARSVARHVEQITELAQAHLADIADAVENTLAQELVEMLGDGIGDLLDGFDEIFDLVQELDDSVVTEIADFLEPIEDIAGIYEDAKPILETIAEFQ